VAQAYNPRLRQKDGECKARLGYIARLHLKKINKNYVYEIAHSKNGKECKTTKDILHLRLHSEQDKQEKIKHGPTNVYSSNITLMC
jgi:hypothetical protein